MTGPEHYRLAEALMESSQAGEPLDGYAVPVPNYPAVEDNGDGPVNTVGNALAAAQVHATLALVAATLATSNRRLTDADDWAEAMS